MSVKGENQQYADIISYLNGALASKNIIGWTVRQSNQPTMVGFNNQTIYITRVGSKRVGWQAHREKWNKSLQKMIHIEEYVEEVLFQVSAFKKRNPTDTTEQTSGDVLSSLITYLQSIDGVNALKALGYQSYRVIEKREPPFVTDMETYEKIPSFDISFVLVQNDEGDIGSTDALNLTLKGI